MKNEIQLQDVPDIAKAALRGNLVISHWIHLLEKKKYMKLKASA